MENKSVNPEGMKGRGSREKSFLFPGGGGVGGIPAFLPPFYVISRPAQQLVIPPSYLLLSLFFGLFSPSSFLRS
jgi:hypothetical protein